MRPLRRSLLPRAAVVGLAFAGVPWTPPAASAARPIRCGDAVTRSVLLTHDLRDCPGHGLIVAADNITIDLGGHVVDGTGSADSMGIGNRGHAGVTIRNGIIREFGRGVVVSAAARNRILNNTIAKNAAEGVFSDRPSRGLLVAGNRISGNGAILPGRKATPETQWADGVDARGAGARITGNVVDRNRDDGVDVGGAGVWVDNNTISRNGSDGVDTDGVGTRIEHNTAIGNGDDGIGIGRHARGPVIKGNIAIGNRDLGIQALPTTRVVVDGGGNRAHGNGDKRQCVRVRCS
jgi:hypothetical protein